LLVPVYLVLVKTGLFNGGRWMAALAASVVVENIKDGC
jgi:hypothetical protein